jgi:hypothetical protein
MNYNINSICYCRYGIIPISPQQQEYDDAEENDHDQQEAPVPDIPPTAPLRRSNRDRVPSTRYVLDQYVMLLSEGLEPECILEAMKYVNKKEWNKATRRDGFLS